MAFLPFYYYFFSQNTKNSFWGAKSSRPLPGFCLWTHWGTGTHHSFLRPLPLFRYCSDQFCTNKIVHNVFFTTYSFVKYLSAQCLEWETSHSPLPCTQVWPSTVIAIVIEQVDARPDGCCDMRPSTDNYRLSQKRSICDCEMYSPMCRFMGRRSF